MRPFTSIISIDEARQTADGGGAADRADRNVSLAEAAGRVGRGECQRSTIDVPPFARSAMDGYALRAADTEAATPPARSCSRSSSASTPGRSRARRLQRHLRRNRDRRAAARRRRRGGHGRGDVARPRRSRVLSSTRAVAGQNIGRRGADIAPGDVVVRRATPEAQPNRRAGRDRVVRSSTVYARPARRGALDRQRSGRAGHAAGRRTDLRRQPLHAGGGRRQHGGVAEPQPAGRTRSRRSAALDACAERRHHRSFPAAARSATETSSSIAIGRPRRDDLSRHRGQAGQADGVRASSTASRSSACPAIRRPACRTPTSCSCRSCAPPPACRSTRRARFARPLGTRIVSPAGRHQFYTVRLRDGVAYPAFKGSGEITSLSQADGYIEIPADQSTSKRDDVEVTLF